jgi:hypothetical protein
MMRQDSHLDAASLRAIAVRFCGLGENLVPGRAPFIVDR